MQNLGVLPGDTSSRADHVNKQRDGGRSRLREVAAYALLYGLPGNEMRPLSSAAGIYSEAFGGNNLGQVVGETSSALGTRAFLWTSQNGMVGFE